MTQSGNNEEDQGEKRGKTKTGRLRDNMVRLCKKESEELGKSWMWRENLGFIKNKGIFNFVTAVFIEEFYVILFVHRRCDPQQVLIFN